MSQVTFGVGDPATLHLSLNFPLCDTERYSVSPVTLGLLTGSKIIFSLFKVAKIIVSGGIFFDHEQRFRGLGHFLAMMDGHFI